MTDEKKKILYNTRLPEDLVKEFKILAIRQSKRQNELLVEAVQDLIEKYDAAPLEPPPKKARKQKK